MNCTNCSGVLRTSWNVLVANIVRASGETRALAAAKFDSVRGKFRFNTNQFPIQSVYLLEVKRGTQGALLNDVTETMAADYPDAYVGQCKMK